MSNPLILSDWRNIPSGKIIDIETAANMETPCLDSLLINGKGTVNCWSAEKIASLLSPVQQQLILLGESKAMTAKA